MLEIASEIIVYLLIAATIGAAIGYLVCKSLSEKNIPASAAPLTEAKPVEEEIETVEREEKPIEVVKTVKKEEKPVKEVETVEREVVIETPEVSQEAAEEEEIEIPTEEAIEKALEALEEIDEQENEIPEEEQVVEKKEEKKPELLSSPRNGEKDKLTLIKGVGPKLEEKLNDAGIFHFYQIASWTNADLEWLDTHTTFASRAKKDGWIAQAKTFI